MSSNIPGVPLRDMQSKKNSYLQNTCHIQTADFFHKKTYTEDTIWYFLLKSLRKLLIFRLHNFCTNFLKRPKSRGRFCNLMHFLNIRSRIMNFSVVFEGPVRTVNRLAKTDQLKKYTVPVSWCFRIKTCSI